jgi:NADH-quinone oxidoreductase subunit N
VNYADLFKLALPETIIVVTALAVLTLGLTSRRRTGLCGLIACAGIVAAALSFLWVPRSANFAEGMLVVSPLVSLFQIVGLALAFFAVLLATNDDALSDRAEFIAILLFATIGLMLLISSDELLMIFVGLELTGLSLYVMAGFNKRDSRSAEAGLKYFLFGSTASAFTLFGLSLIYGTFGSTNLPSIASSVSTAPLQPVLAAGIVMALIGFFFKVAAAPFHLWAPDTYQGSPTTSAAFIASASKVASFLVLGKILLVGFPGLGGSAAWHAFIPGWKPIVAVVAGLSILIGNFAALAQSDVRRLLAYSAVAHAGYTLLGLIAGGVDGFSATLFYSATYAVTLVGAFGVVGVVERQTGGTALENFRDLRARSPFLTACMALFLLSLAGLPPLPGFFGKFYLFSVALHSGGGSSALLWLVALALFGSLVSLYYYLSVLKVMLLGKRESETPSVLHPRVIERLAVATLAIIVALLGLFPNLLLARIAAALS